MSIQPDIVIIDEALAAGDAYFVRKCRKRIHEICRSGATVIFVSHDPSQVEELCDHALFMVGGKILDQGPPAEITRRYNDWVFQVERGGIRQECPAGLPILAGSGDVIIESVALLDKNNKPDTAFYTGDPMTIRLQYCCPNGDVPAAEIFCGLLARPNLQYVGEMNTSGHNGRASGREGAVTLHLKGRGHIDLRLDPILLLNNTYSLWLKIFSDSRTLASEYRDIAPFFVARRSHSLSRGPFLSHPFQIEAAHA